MHLEVRSRGFIPRLGETKTFLYENTTVQIEIHGKSWAVVRLIQTVDVFFVPPFSREKFTHMR